MIRPLRLRHLHTLRQDSRKSLVSSCSLALHMSKGEEKLLQYYAKQQDGFRPSLLHISNTIGVTTRQVKYLRIMLSKHGVIKVDTECVYIDWERIRLFSTLDPAMTSKHCTIAPVRIEKFPHKVYVSRELRLRLRSLPVPELCDLFAAMNEEEYRMACRYLEKEKFSP